MDMRLFALLMFLTLIYLLFRRPSSAASRRYPTELNFHIGNPIYLTNEKLERAAIACTAGTDLRVCPGLGMRTTTGADTQVCPYGDLQPALKKKTVSPLGLGGMNRTLLRGAALAFTLVLPTGAVAMPRERKKQEAQSCETGYEAQKRKALIALRRKISERRTK